MQKMKNVFGRTLALLLCLLLLIGALPVSMLTAFAAETDDAAEAAFAVHYNDNQTAPLQKIAEGDFMGRGNHPVYLASLPYGAKITGVEGANFYSYMTYSYSGGELPEETEYLRNTDFTDFLDYNGFSRGMTYEPNCFLPTNRVKGLTALFLNEDGSNLACVVLIQISTVDPDDPDAIPNLVSLKTGSSATLSPGAGDTYDYLLQYTDASRIQLQVTLDHPDAQAWICHYKTYPAQGMIRGNVSELQSDQLMTVGIDDMNFSPLYLVVGWKKPEVDNSDMASGPRFTFDEKECRVYRIQPSVIFGLGSLKMTQQTAKGKVIPYEPAFSHDTLSYTGEVPYNVKTVTITVMPNVTTGDVRVKLYVNDAETAAYTTDAGSSFQVNLPVSALWDNGRIKLTMVGEYQGQTSSAYTLVLTRSYLPVILQQPVSSTASAGNPATLTVTAEGPEDMTYQWYRNTTKSTAGGEAVFGATEPSYTPDLTQFDPNEILDQTVYYYCVLSASVGEERKTVTTGVVSLTYSKDLNLQISDAAGKILSAKENLLHADTDAPLTLQLQYDVPDGAPDGTWSYQWTAANKKISGAEEASYTLPAVAEDSSVLYCGQLVYTRDGKTKTFSSEKIRIETYFTCPIKAVIGRQPQNQEYLVGEKEDYSKRLNLYSVSSEKKCTDSSRLKYAYQWEFSADNIHFSDASGTGAATPYFQPLRDTIGVFYYRCRVKLTYTNRAGDEFVSDPIYSDTAAVTVVGHQIDLDGEGTSASPFLIHSADDLVLLRDKVVNDGVLYSGAEFKFADELESITLPEDWTSIGVKGKAFGGHIDGNGKLLIIPRGGQALVGNPDGASVRNLNIYGEKVPGYGLVTYYTVGNTMTIDNVTIKSGSHILKSGFVGGYGNTSVNISNCTIEEGVVIGDDGTWEDYPEAKESLRYDFVGELDYRDCIGSFCGAWNGTIVNCVSYATVYGRDNVGGIVGFKGQSMRDCYIYNCAFYGKVIASGTMAGGIVGSGYTAASGPNTPCVTIENCYVTGDVQGRDRVGGIFGGEAGSVNAWGNGIGHIRNNFFTGSVKATDGRAAGGIIGYLRSMNRYNDVCDNYYVNGTVGIGQIDQIVDANSSDKENYTFNHHYGRYDDPLTSEQVTKRVSAAALTDGTLLDLLNCGRYGDAWQQGSATPVFASGVHLIGLHAVDNLETNPEIKVEGNSSNDYSELNERKVTAVYSDGTVRTILASQGTFSGADLQKAGYQMATFSYGNNTLNFGLEVRKKFTGMITVSVTVLGDSSHNSDEDGEVHTLSGGNLITWVSKEEREVPDNSSVLNVLTQLFRERGIDYVNDGGNYISSVTAGGITLEEIQNGANSGWMYTLNGIHSNLGVAEQYLSDGDELVFHYTDDYTRETPIAPIYTREQTEFLIDRIGTVTAGSKAAIQKARAAYETLNSKQKALLSNYEVLVAAEAAYAELVSQGGVDPIQPTPTPIEYEVIYKAVGDYLSSLGVPDVGSVGGEWLALGLARSGREVSAEYYNNVVKYVKEHINDKEQLHRSKSTDNARVILALTALGYDVTDVGGHNLLAGLTDMKYIKRQGINGPIWALLAFDSHDYEIPAGNVSREGLISAVLDAQLENGGWALGGTEADPDITAMALQALAPYYRGNTTVKQAIDKALDRLSSMQDTTGGYLSWGSLNSESCAQVIVALTALGIDPQTDARFIKNGCSVVDALSAFYMDRGFRHTMDGELNGMATEQGYYALTALARLRNGKTGLYDMKDVVMGTGGNVPQNPITGDDSTNVMAYWALLMLASAAAFMYTAVRKRTEKQQ